MAVLAEGRAAAGLAGAAAGLGTGDRATLWGFEGPSARAALERALAARGVRAELRAAFGAPVPAAREVVAAPRFLAELWPLPAGVRTGLRAGPPGWRADGQEVFAPLRPVTAPGGRAAEGCCGWMRVEGGREGPVETGLERAVFALLDAAGRAGGEGRGPWFGVLRLRVEADFEDARLAEAVHEELYFGALEALRARAGAAPGDRALTPGKVVPEVVHRAGAAEVVWRAETGPAETAASEPEAPCAPERLTAPPSEGEVLGALTALGGRRLEVRSRQGRAVRGAVLAGPAPGAVIGGGQHGNEPTGVVGALLAARALRGEGALGVAPLENPDGWAVYARLRRDWPGHMHHAARYTASGADLAHAPGFEGALRRRLAEAVEARLFVSLHGYPAGAWLRPFTGGLPAGFEDWALPRGVFLILRVAPGWEAPGRAVLAAAARALSAEPAVADLNRAQRAAFRRSAPGAPEEARIGEVGVIETGPQPGAPWPVELVTETPDETVTGARFRLLARAQAVAAAAAVRAWRALGPR
ncbi:MAG: hypothetical protein R6V44_17905 [Paracoccaceae bacterium]